jgi:hypothetical protein
MMRWTNLLLVTCLGLVVAACATESEQVAFVETLGNDTVAVEVFSRTADGFEGKVLIRSPMTQVAHYEATLTPDGNISTMKVEWTTPPENPDGHPPIVFDVAIEGDSATVEVTGAPNAGSTRMAAPEGAIPTAGLTPMSYAVLEQAVRQAVAAGGDEYPVHFIVPARGRLAPNAIQRVDEDVISFDFFGSPFYAQVSSEGAILHRSGEHTTMKVVGQRSADVDFDALAADYAARDARGEGMGPASPQATIQVEAGGANLEVVYSRPAKRGREIWGGNLVPWEEVWRTGANAATSFTTDRDLVIGGSAVPAGSYTLWSVFTPESAQLIVNKQTGQWGTQYDAEQDLVRIDLEKQDLPHPVERFTIGIEATDDGAVLGLTWDTVRYLVPIEVR